MPTTQIILASQSPRRKELLKLMGFEFKIEVHEVEETFPDNLAAFEVALFIANKKANAFKGETTNKIIITADTIVSIDNEILGKPLNAIDAKLMLQKLSGKVHEVYTAVCIYHNNQLISFYDTTQVTFKELSEPEIDFYIQTYQPFDKAGAYGIQEWIGLIGVVSINGSYTNVMGLPTEKLFPILNRCL